MALCRLWNGCGHSTPLQPSQGGQAGDRRMAHVIGAGDRGQRLAVGAATERLTLLVGGELRAPAEVDPAGLRAGASLAGADADQLTFELGQPAEDREQQTAVRGRGVGPAIPQRGEPGAFPRDGGERVEQVARAAGEAVQPRYQQHVTGGEPGEHLAQLCAVRFSTARDFTVHFARTRGSQCRDLRLDALPIGGDSRISA
jgi:hypothetical protein